MPKLNFTRWGETYSTPHLVVIVNKPSPHWKGYIQISFVVWNFHWWVQIPYKSSKSKAN